MENTSVSVVEILKILMKQRKTCVANMFDVPEEIYKMIKKAIRNNPGCIVQLHRCLLADLESKSAPIRIRLLKLCYYLIPRCGKFRALFLSDIKDIVRKTGVVRVLGKSAVKTHQRELETILFRFVSEWDADYGLSFPGLRALVRYMRESLHLPLPDVNKERQALQEESNSTIAENIALVRARLRQAFNDMDSQWMEITANMDTLEEAFRVLFPAMGETGSGMFDDMFETTSVGQLTVPTSQSIVNDDVDSDWEDGHIESITHTTTTAAADTTTAAVSVPFNSTHSMGESTTCRRYGMVTYGDDDDSETMAVPDDRNGVLKKRRLIDESGDGDSSVCSVVRDAHLGNMTYSLEITVPAAADLQTDDNKVVVENIRELARQMKFHTLPRLHRWKLVISEARQIYLDHPFAATLPVSIGTSVGTVGVVDIDYRLGLVEKLIEYVEEALSDRCIALLGFEALS